MANVSSRKCDDGVLSYHMQLREMSVALKNMIVKSEFYLIFYY